MARLRLILASRSPRRRQLLADAGYHFRQIDPPFNDQPPPAAAATDPEELVVNLALRKAHSVIDDSTLQIEPNALILGADTLVVGPSGQLLGQPTDADDARSMLRALADARHQVITGIALVRAGAQEPTCLADTAAVSFGPIGDAQLEQYLATGHWRGKAGGYNLADLQDHWPIDVAGDPTTVVGLPMNNLQPLLRRFDIHPDRSTSAGRSHERFLAVIDGSEQSLAASAARSGLALLEPSYTLAIAARNTLFDKHLRRTRHLLHPVISIGNLTTGGTGKTPMVIDLARRLRALGRRPAILTRGYKSTDGFSDEAAVMQLELGQDMPVEVNGDRAAGAAAVLARAPRTDVFLLDDGFQHRQIHRDLDIVLIDATCPFGYGHLLPRGLLREPKVNLARADAVIVTRADQSPPDRLA